MQPLCSYYLPFFFTVKCLDMFLSRFTSLPVEVRFQTPVLCLSQSFQFTYVVVCTCAGHSSWDPVLLKFSDNRNWVSLFPRTLIFILSVLCTVLLPKPWITSCHSRCSVNMMYREELWLICPPTPSRNVSKGSASPFSGLFCKGLLLSHVLQFVCVLYAHCLPVVWCSLWGRYTALGCNGCRWLTWSSQFHVISLQWPLFPPKGNFNSSSFKSNHSISPVGPVEIDFLQFAKTLAKLHLIQKCILFMWFIVPITLRFSGKHFIWSGKTLLKSELKFSNPSLLEVFPSNSYHYSSPSLNCDSTSWWYVKKKIRSVKESVIW